MTTPEDWDGTTIHVPPELLDWTTCEDMTPVLVAFIEGAKDGPSPPRGEP